MSKGKTTQKKGTGAKKSAFGRFLGLIAGTPEKRKSSALDDILAAPPMHYTREEDQAVPIALEPEEAPEVTNERPAHRLTIRDRMEQPHTIWGLLGYISYNDPEKQQDIYRARIAFEELAHVLGIRHQTPQSARLTLTQDHKEKVKSLLSQILERNYTATLLGRIEVQPMPEHVERENISDAVRCVLACAREALDAKTKSFENA